MLPANSAKAYGHLKASALSKLYGQPAIMHSADGCGATRWLEVLTHLQASSGSIRCWSPVAAAVALATLRPNAASPKLIMRVGPVPDAMKPGFHGVRTHWNQGFMAFTSPRRTRIVILMVPE